MGKHRSDDSLSSKLLDIINTGKVTEPNGSNEESTGLTDNESDNEETEQVIDYINESEENVDISN